LDWNLFGVFLPNGCRMSFMTYWNDWSTSETDSNDYHQYASIGWF